MLENKLTDKEYLNSKIEEFKKINKACDIQLLEKTIGALYLVELLSQNNLDFVFKGGTSLTILLDDIKRFSVDVDIITEENFDKVDKLLSKIVNESKIFTRLEENYRNNAVTKRMRIKHYKLYCKSVLDESEKFVLIDVALEKSVYPKVIEKTISSDKLGLNSNLKVKLPSLESILGDKLTVLSPNLTGIGLNSEKQLELVKQIYDVNNLFDMANDIADIRESFTRICDRELEYRKIDGKTFEDVLDDIEFLCFRIIIQDEEDILNFLSTGIAKFTNYMLKKAFKRDEEVLTAACKILYLSKCIRNNLEIEKYDATKEVVDNIDYDQIDVQLRRRIKTIKKLDKEEFYYINKIYEIM